MITVNIVDNQSEIYKELLHKEVECEQLRKRVIELVEENTKLQRLCDMKDEILRKGSVKNEKQEEPCYTVEAE